LSFYGSKMILDVSNVFWSGPNHFGQVQIIKISPEKSNLNLTNIIWTWPKQFGPHQNNLYPSKTIWIVQNQFGPIEGQGINNHFFVFVASTWTRCPEGSTNQAYSSCFYFRIAWKLMEWLRCCFQNLGRVPRRAS
jgi:hypothetical protein